MHLPPIVATFLVGAELGWPLDDGWDWLTKNSRWIGASRTSYWKDSNPKGPGAFLPPRREAAYPDLEHSSAHTSQNIAFGNTGVFQFSHARVCLQSVKAWQISSSII